MDPRFKPLYARLLRLSPLEYLISHDFSLFLLEWDLEQLWDQCVYLNESVGDATEVARIALSTFIELGIQRPNFGHVLVELLRDFDKRFDRSPHDYEEVFRVMLDLEKQRFLALGDWALDISTFGSATAQSPAPNQVRVTAAATAVPRVFIGSSAEGLRVAEELQANLEYAAHSTIWSQGVFGLSGGTLETLANEASSYDFAILVLTPDDVVLTSRNELANTARDNVLLELGLFVGALGRMRTFIVHPRAKMHLPSDVAGVTAATYDPTHAGGLRPALGTAATDIKAAMSKQGVRSR